MKFNPPPASIPRPEPGAIPDMPVPRVPCAGAVAVAGAAVDVGAVDVGAGPIAGLSPMLAAVETFPKPMLGLPREVDMPVVGDGPKFIPNSLERLPNEFGDGDSAACAWFAAVLANPCATLGPKVASVGMAATFGPNVAQGLANTAANQ